MSDLDLKGIDLTNRFSIYYRLNEEGLSRDMKATEFANQVKLIQSFDSLKSFWNIFQHLRKPDNCKIGTELFIFINDIKPLWEDPSNKDGGKTSVRLTKSYSSIIWEELTLAFIGQIFPSNIYSDITGIVISIRKESNVLQLWFKDYDNKKAKLIENTLRDLIMVPDNVEIETKPFFKNSNYVSFKERDLSCKNNYKKEDSFKYNKLSKDNIEFKDDVQISKTKHDNNNNNNNNINSNNSNISLHLIANKDIDNTQLSTLTEETYSYCNTEIEKDQDNVLNIDKDSELNKECNNECLKIKDDNKKNIKNADCNIVKDDNVENKNLKTLEDNKNKVTNTSNKNLNNSKDNNNELSRYKNSQIYNKKKYKNYYNDDKYNNYNENYYNNYSNYDRNYNYNNGNSNYNAKYESYEYNGNNNYNYDDSYNRNSKYKKNKKYNK